MIWQASGGDPTHAAPIAGGEESAGLPYHEFYLDDFEPRAALPAAVGAHPARPARAPSATKVREANLALRSEGVTFTVYSDEDEGIERVWPFDLHPAHHPRRRVGDRSRPGLKQRVRALNLFLARPLPRAADPQGRRRAGRADLRRQATSAARSSASTRRTDIYIHISGIDLVRDGRGRYLVLEDNLRTPSGVSYMIENRIVERRILPEFFAKLPGAARRALPGAAARGAALPLAARQGRRRRSCC